MNIQFPVVGRKYDHLIIHCAATKASMTDVDALWVDRVHRRKGWSGCGYNAVIPRDGTLEHQPTGHRTRPYHRTGAHVGGCGEGWNERSLGLCLAGGVAEDGTTPEDNFTVAQLTTMIDYIFAAVDWFGIPIENVIGHRDLIKQTGAAPKACPCFSVREKLYRGSDDKDFNPAPWAYSLARGDKTLRVGKYHTVAKGETLWRISTTLGVPLETIRDLNGGLSDNVITPGQKLRLR